MLWPCSFSYLFRYPQTVQALPVLPSPAPSSESESDASAAAAAKVAGGPEAGATGAVAPRRGAMVWLREAPARVAPVAAVSAARGAVEGAEAAPQTPTGVIPSVVDIARCSVNEAPCGWARGDVGWGSRPGPRRRGSVALTTRLSAKQPAHNIDACR